MLPQTPSDPFAYVQDWHEALRGTGWWHSFKLPGGEVIQGVSSLAAQETRIRQFPIPEDLRGKRVLDVGTWDGWFAFEMERRGAEVVAMDRWENPRFYEIHRLLRSRIDYRQMSVYDLDPAHLGRFDIVLFMGVLYHLKHPLLALERVCSVAQDLVAVESFVLRDRHRPGLGVEEQPLMEFYERDEFGGEFDNWVAPTVPCLLGFLRTAGFVRVEVNNVHEYGAAVNCYRTWGSAALPVTPDPALRVVGAFHTDTGGINFRSRSSDEYVGCRVSGDNLSLTVESVRPEVSGFAAEPVFVGTVEGYWQVNFKLPPGLLGGWHQVRLRTPVGESNSVEIAVDLPVSPERLHVGSACDGVSWKQSEISLTNGFASIWVDGLPKNADIENVRVRIGGLRQFTTFVGRPDTSGATQVNVRVSATTPLGWQQLALRCGLAEAPPLEVQIVA